MSQVASGTRSVVSHEKLTCLSALVCWMDKLLLLDSTWLGLPVQTGHSNRDRRRYERRYRKTERGTVRHTLGWTNNCVESGVLLCLCLCCRCCCWVFGLLLA